jgi:uncharacterized integral membrane protein (TIGR00698 family)
MSQGDQSFGVVKKPGKYFPAAWEISEAIPGLLIIVLPILLITELLWWLEISSKRTYFVDIFIAATIALVVANVFKIPDKLRLGTAFAQKWFLRLGIMIYGLKFSFSYLAIVGWQGLAVVSVAIASAILLAMVVGRAFGLEERIGALLGAGTAICGIAAMMATAPSIKAKEEEVGVAIGVVLLWGTLALFAYPVIAAAVHMPAAVYGTWCGASIHDLPQIVAAALQGGGNEGLKAALMIKMIRMAFVIVVVLGMCIYFAVNENKENQNKCSLTSVAINAVPGYVVGFFLVILLNTLVKIPMVISGPLATYPASVTPFTAASLLLSAAIIGICTRVTTETIRKAGFKAIITGLIAWVVQSGLVLWLSYAYFS